MNLKSDQWKLPSLKNRQKSDEEKRKIALETHRPKFLNPIFISYKSWKEKGWYKKKKKIWRNDDWKPPQFIERHKFTDLSSVKLKDKLKENHTQIIPKLLRTKDEGKMSQEQAGKDSSFHIGEQRF